MRQRIANWDGAELKTSLLLLSAGAIAWNLPTPEGLTPQAWQILIIFLGTIIGIIAKPLPVSGVALFSLSVAAITKTLTIEQTLANFSYPVVWLVVLAFFISRAFIMSGLGDRIAYWFIAILGKNTTGLSYGIILTEFVLAPFIPSNGARGGGIIFPIVNSLAHNLEHNKTVKHTLAGFLILLAFHANVITSTMFLTGNAGNPLVVSMADSVAGVKMDWFNWFQAAIVPGIISLLTLPLLMHFLYPLEDRKTPNAPKMARAKLKEMGPMSDKEKIMSVTFLIMLALWVLGGHLGVNATTAAFLGLSVLLFTGVIKVDDIMKEHNAWQTFIWFSTLLTLGKYLGDYGVVTWVSTKIYGQISHLNWMSAFGIIGLLYYYSHYAFASISAHFSTLYSVSLGLAISLGTPPLLAAYVLVFASGLSSCLTHFGTTPAPIFFGAGYVSVPDWWKVGGLLGIAHLLVWVVVGGAWWKFLGFW